jgi:simple sugar transport system permease protein
MGINMSDKVAAGNKRGENRLANALVRMRALNVFIIFILLFIVFTVFSPGNRFISRENMQVFLSTGAEFNIVAIVVGMLMIAGEFDLSVGSILVFSSWNFYVFYNAGVHVLLSLFIVLCVGGIVGFINGIITVKAKIPSFITTLGTMLLWRGVTLLWSGGLQAGMDLTQNPVMYGAFTGVIGELIPAQFLWFLGVALVIALVMHFHKLGNWIFTTGDNKMAARAMGIQTDRIKVICFTVVGVAVSFVAVMQLFRASTFGARAGDGWELKAIAASVVGGTALTGGIGSMMGIFWGALVISIIENGLIFLRINYWWTFSVFGVIIVSTAIISKVLEQRRVMLGAERN